MENMSTRFSDKYPLIADSTGGFESWRLIVERTLALALDVSGECHDAFDHVVTWHKCDTGLPHEATTEVTWAIVAEIIISDVEAWLEPKPPRPTGGDLRRLRNAIGRSATGKPEPKPVQGNKDTTESESQ